MRTGVVLTITRWPRRQTSTIYSWQVLRAAAASTGKHLFYDRLLSAYCVEKLGSFAIKIQTSVTSTVQNRMH